MSTQFEGLVPGTYAIDPSHSEVGFTVRHLMGKVRGQFREFEGTLDRRRRPAGVVRRRATIDLSSVDTRNSDRDNHLRSGDFFSVDEHAEDDVREHRHPRQAATSSVATRRPDHQGRHQAGRARPRLPRRRPRPVGRQPRRLRGHHHDQPQGVGRRTSTSRSTATRSMIGDKVNVVIAVEAVLQAEAA